MTIAELLGGSRHPLHRIASHQTIAAAITRMARHGVRALVVQTADPPEQLVTEGNLFRRLLTIQPADIAHVTVAEILVPDPISAVPADAVADHLETMLAHQVRHLPVVEAGRVTAILRLEELVSDEYKALQQEIHMLKEYIHALHNAPHD